MKSLRENPSMAAILSDRPLLAPVFPAIEPGTGNSLGSRLSNADSRK
jgi:hypothetical protein